MRKHLFGLLALGLVAGGCSAADTEPSGVPSEDESAAWNAAYEENTSGKADTDGCSGVVVPDRSGFKKHITLTFDDGPNLTTTPIVLDTLAKHKATGTFFVNGSKITSQAQKDLLKKMSEAGHHIGNHSHSHLNLKNESASTVETQIAKTQALLEGLDMPQRYFRFPFGSASCSAAKAVRDHGYVVTGWHIDSADWCFASGRGGVGHCDASVFKYVDSQYRDDMTGYIVSQAKSLGGGVMLMHDIHANTANMLDEVLTALEEAGFSFVDISDTTTFPKLNGATPVQPSTTWIGSPCKDNAGCDFTASGKPATCYKFTAGGVASGVCTIPCEGTCPDQDGSAPTFCTSLDDGTTGTCLAKSHSLNHQCADIPGTVAKQVDRFLGTSSSSPATAAVCLPNE